MSEKNNIDALFKKGLENFQEQPSENIWLGVEKGLWLKKMLRSGLGLFIGTVVITATALIVFMLTKNHQQTTQPVSATPQQTSVTQNTQTTNNENASNTELSVLKNTDKSVETAHSEKQALKDKPSNAQNSPESVISPNIKVQNNQAAITNKSNRTHLSKITLKDKNSEKEPVQKLIQDEVLTQAKPISEKPKSDIFNNPKEKEQKIVENKDTSIPSNQTETAQNPLNNAQNNALGEAVKTPTPQIEKPEDIIQKQEPQTENLNNAAETPNDKNISVFYEPKVIPKPSLMLYDLLFYVMPSYTGKTLSGISQEEIDFRKNNEKAQVFLNYGMEFRVRFKNISVQTGFIQTQAGEKNKALVYKCVVINLS